MIVSRTAALLLCALVGPSITPAGLTAQEPPDSAQADSTVFRVQGLEVAATRPVTTVGGASAFEVDLSALHIPAAASIEQVLRELPAIHLRTNSRGEAEISVRGSESRQVAVLMDGVPLTLGWDFRTDVSVLPAGAVRDISFIRGLSSMLHGPNVLGGVVEMNVGRGRAVPGRASLTAAATADDRGGHSMSATGERPFTTRGGEGFVRGGAGFRNSPGFPLPGGVEEPVPVEDGLRLNSDTESLSGFAAVRYEAEAGPWASLAASSFRAERGIGAEIGALEPRLWRYPDIRRTVVAISGGTGFHDTPLGRGDLEASLGFDVGSSEIRSFATRAYDEVVGTEDGRDRTLTMRLLGDHTLGARGDLASSFTFSNIHHEAVVDGEAADYRQHLMSLGAETDWRLYEGPDAVIERLNLSVGGAWDRGSTPETGGLPSLGQIDDWGGRIGVSALASDGATLVHAGVSRRGRFPALREMYSEALARFVPNPDLRPEHLVAFEAGLTTRLGEGEIQLVAFRHDLDGAIRRLTLEDGRRQRVNADQLKSTGVELLVRQTTGIATWGGDVTVQSVELVDPTTSLSQRAENLPERSGRAWITVRTVAQIEATAEAEYTGPQFCQDPDSGADVELDGGTWLNATLARVWSLGRGARRIETSFSTENLTDTALYDQCGLPRPGRLFQIQLSVS